MNSIEALIMALDRYLDAYMSLDRAVNSDQGQCRTESREMVDARDILREAITALVRDAGAADPGDTTQG